MTLAAILDPLADRLADALGGGATVGDSAPTVTGDLPAVVLSLDGVERRLVGVGRVPRGTRRGALVVEIDIDLADPVLDLGGGETLDLLSADRRTLVVPHGPLVRADATEDTPFGPGDVVADDGAAFTVVAANPQGRQLVVDPVEGTFTFGDPLAAGGALALLYHVGQWDVSVTRAQGVLLVTAAAADADAVRDLVREVATALDTPAADVRLSPIGWGAARQQALGDDDTQHTQTLAYRFDAEVEQPLLTTGGGIIRRVEVLVRLPVGGGFASEAFAVTREGSPA